jgi:hypothetical protein
MEPLSFRNDWDISEMQRGREKRRRNEEEKEQFTG